jgi:acetoin utilization deacetylase AcuC-like enzyme
MPLTIYTSPYSLKHDIGSDHPENINRIKIIENLLNSEIYSHLSQVVSKRAELDQILLAHDESYVFDLQDKTPETGLSYWDSDTILTQYTYEAALHATGAACQATNDILARKTTKAFCTTRPPGHHAEPNTALGFCFFNHIFIAARHAQEAHGIKRIAIVDFDVHHGNGTETMSKRHNATHPNSPIFYISSHEMPLFPGTGRPEDNNDTLLNIPLQSGTGSEDFRKLYKDQVFPALEAFQPELLLLSSGFDAHKDDPLASINLEAEDFGWLTTELCTIANKYCDGRVLSVLEGGYNLDALSESVNQHLTALISADKG